MLMTPRPISKPYPTTPTPSSPSAPAYMTSAPAWAATTSNVTAARQTSNFHQMCVHSSTAVPCEFPRPVLSGNSHLMRLECGTLPEKKNPCNNFPLYQLQQCTSFWPLGQIHQPPATCGTALSQSSTGSHSTTGFCSKSSFWPTKPCTASALATKDLITIQKPACPLRSSSSLQL